MTQREYLGWQLYWKQEPWGPWRDNLHAAIIARELRGLRGRGGSRIKLDDFMIRDPEERKRESAAGFFNLLRSVSKRQKS